MGDPGLGLSQIRGIEHTTLPTEAEVSVLVTGFGVSGVPYSVLGDHFCLEANLVPDKGTSRSKPTLPMLRI